MTITVSAIAAMSRNFVIGKDNKLLWHIPEDFKHFKTTTMGKPVIMGRRTYESLGKPLPGRTNIVISRSLPPHTPPSPTGEGGQRGAGPFFVQTLDEALTMGEKIAEEDGVSEIFIIGGGQIYEAAMPQTDRIYLTVINQDYEGDTFFPKINPLEWSEEIIVTAEEPVPYMIGILNRKK